MGVGFLLFCFVYFVLLFLCVYFFDSKRQQFVFICKQTGANSQVLFCFWEGGIKPETFSHEAWRLARLVFWREPAPVHTHARVPEVQHLFPVLVITLQPPCCFDLEAFPVDLFLFILHFMYTKIELFTQRLF